ncbi:DUF6319 family protein [Saccharopolyspora rosea]|uniref:DUF6319 family protein n=1 Tax=Saccharopolyspora rosea TaxID=524884 RepID=A0ABW3FNU1_9PSEU|nr:DUF6319 family protein [Saccharopolyspora rosea]
MTEEQPGTDQSTAAATAPAEATSDQTAQHGRTPEESTADTSAESADNPAPKKKRTKSTARKTRTVELTLTVTGTAEGEWQADLLHSGKRVVQGLSIPAAAVSKAAAELHQDISETIESVISAAREQHEAKLAELEAEVERVRKALAELEN